MRRPFRGIYINPNITSPSKAGIGLQPPPPMMRGAMMMGRRRLVGLAIVVGLVFLVAGAVLVDESHARPNPGETQEAAIARENLGLVWGPAVAHIGMFLFVIGLISAAVFFEELDIFVRLFLVILSFLAVLLILAGSTTIFGVPSTRGGQQCQDSARKSGTWAGRPRSIWASWSSVSSPS